MSLRLATLLTTALCVTACSGSGSNYNSAPSPTPTPAPPGSTSVTIPSGASTQTTTAFGPNPLTVSAGTTISWLNSDGTTHRPLADANQWDAGNIAPGTRSNLTFSTTGRFPYHCQIHPNMTGTIVVQ